MPVFSSSPEANANNYIVKMGIQYGKNSEKIKEMERYFKENWDFQESFFKKDG